MVEQGAQVIVVPAAFNMTTGPAHWEILFRCRQWTIKYMLSGAPARDLDFSYHSYGNSIIVDPWGKVVSRLDEKKQCLFKKLTYQR